MNREPDQDTSLLIKVAGESNNRNQHGYHQQNEEAKLPDMKVSISKNDVDMTDNEQIVVTSKNYNNNYKSGCPDNYDQEDEQYYQDESNI